jgi:hypothetical protein
MIAFRIILFVGVTFFISLLILQSYDWAKGVKVLAFIFSPLFVIGWLLYYGYQVLKILAKEAFK